MTVNETFENFILSRRLSGLSGRTVKNYVDFVKPFIQYVGETLDFLEITQSLINHYIAGLLDKNISKATLATYIRHLKIYLKWADEEYTGSYSVQHIKVPKTPKKNVHVYSDSEIQTIFEMIHSDIPWITARNRAIVALMLDSGLRQGEVCMLQKKRVFLKQQYMMVTGKGGKDRTVPHGNISCACLERYLSVCPYELDFMFIARSGEPLSCNAIKLMVTKLAKLLPFDLSSHKLRHNFATNYCLDQYNKYGHIDIQKLMYLMGHEDAKTTARYLHFAYEMIAVKENISHIDSVLSGKSDFFLEMRVKHI